MAAVFSIMIPVTFNFPLINNLKAFTTDATNSCTLNCGLFNGSVLPAPAKILVYPLSHEMHNPREED